MLAVRVLGFVQKDVDIDDIDGCIGILCVEFRVEDVWGQGLSFFFFLRVVSKIHQIQRDTSSHGSIKDPSFDSRNIPSSRGTGVSRVCLRLKP